MCSLLLRVVLVVYIFPSITPQVEEICQLCECLPPGPEPTQAICRDNSPSNKSSDKVFSPITTQRSITLQVIYISDWQTVNLTEFCLTTEKPVTLFIQNCTTVYISDRAVEHLQTLLVTSAMKVKIGKLPREDLWATVLENIGELTVASTSLSANYSVSIGHVGLLTLTGGQEEICVDSPELRFNMFDTTVNPISRGGISLCGGHITFNSNTFKSVAEEGFQVTTEGSVVVVNNRFENITKESFIFSAPEIHITGNHFDNLPAGALRGVSTVQDTFFTNNTISDVDLGGVLLDMGWDMVVEQNVVQCDCASKRTSILNPKQDMLYLTNSSFDKLHNIFLNNFCNLNCSVTLRAFSYALIQGDVCLTNDTTLEQRVLCHMAVPRDSSTPPTTTDNSDNGSLVSAATRAEFVFPISIIVISILLSSMWYGCREVRAFKYNLNLSREVELNKAL